MKDLRELTVAELTEVTASDAPAPGGGSISALAGALSAALAGMVSASVFIYLSSTWDVNILRKLFGGLLLLSAWKELRYQNNQQESSHS